MRRSVSTLIQRQHWKKRKNCETSRSVAKRLIWTKRPLGCTITCLQPSMYSLTLFSPFRRDKAGCATRLEQSPLQDSDSLITKPHINSFSKINRREDDHLWRLCEALQNVSFGLLKTMEGIVSRKTNGFLAIQNDMLWYAQTKLHKTRTMFPPESEQCTARFSST